MRWRAGLLALGIAAAALVAAWRLTPSAAPPVFDGCITEPYRFLGGNPAPASSSKTYPATQSSDNAVVTTGDPPSTESPAQGQVLLQAGSFASSEPYTVSVTPVMAPQPPPAGMTVDGNAYRIVAVTASAKQLNTPADTPATIVLRGTSSTGPTRAMYRLDATKWTKLDTTQAGCGDIYEAVSSRLGVFAIMVPAGSSPEASGGGFPVFIAIPALIAVLLATVLLLLRLNRPPERR